MTWWLWLTIGVLVGAVIGLFVAALVALADESYEGRGTLEFDTPEARRSLLVQPVDFQASNDQPRPGGPA